MSKEDKVKIVLAGPKEVGKTVIANYLAGDRVLFGQEYRPTIGVRIREFDTFYSKLSKVSVELWDVSGDVNFENCWKTILQDVHGVIIVFDPESRTANKDLEFWYNAFVKSSAIKDHCCLVLAHNKKVDARETELRLPKLLSKVLSSHTCFEPSNTGSNAMTTSFQRLLEAAVARSRENEEKMVL
jgi:GTPase SAR1 family protein